MICWLTALYEITEVLNADPSVDVLYTDEDKVTMDLKKHFDPHCKSDFNLDLLRSNNYICHFFVVKRRLWLKLGNSVQNSMAHRTMILF